MSLWLPLFPIWGAKKSREIHFNSREMWNRFLCDEFDQIRFIFWRCYSFSIHQKRFVKTFFIMNILVICHRFKCYSQSLRLLFTFFIHVILIVNEKKIRCLLRQMLHRTLSIFWFVHQNALSLSLSRARHITFAYMYGFIFYSMSVRTLHIRLPYTAA